MRISSKLAVLFSTLIIFVGLVPSALFSVFSTRQLEASVVDQIQSMAIDAINTTDHMLYERYLDIGMFAADPILKADNSTAEQIAARLKSYKRSHPDYLSLSFFDLNRVRIADTENQAVGVRHSLSEYWPDLLAGKNPVSILSYSESAGKPVFYFASLVDDQKGKPRGVVVSRLSLHAFNTILDEHLNEYGLSNKVTSELIDRSGTVIYASPNSSEKFGKPSAQWEEIKTLVDGGANSGRSGGVVRGNLLVVSREAGYHGFKGNGWVLAIEVPERVVFAEVWRMRDWSRLFLLLMAGLAFPAVFLFSRTIVGPINRLRLASAEIGRGNLDARVGIVAKDEVGELAAAFNRMAEELQRSSEARNRAEAESREQRELIGRILECTPHYIFWKDRELNYLGCNANFARAAGLSAPEEIVGKSDFDLPWGRTLAASFLATDREILSSGEARLDYEGQKFQVEGRPIDALVSKVPLFDADGNVMGVLGLYTDISERKQAEEKLLRSRASLRAIMDNAPYMIWLKDCEGRYVAANMEFLKASGRAGMGEVIGKSDYDIWPRDLAEKFHADDMEVMRSRRQKLMEEYAFNSAGVMSWLETLKIPVLDKNGQLLGTSGFARDIAARRKMERELKRDAEQFEALLTINELGGSVPENEFLCSGLEWAEKLTDSQTSFLHIVSEDQQSIELLAWSSASPARSCTTGGGSPCPVAEAGRWADCLGQRRPVIFNDYESGEHSLGLPAGHSALQRLACIPVIEEGVVRIILGVGNKETDYDDDDVKIVQLLGNDLWRIVRRQRTEAELKRNLERQRVLNKKLEEAQSHLLQSEKMAALGQLAAGVAHEINNPLGFVNSNLGTLESYLSDIFAINAACEDAGNSVDERIAAIERHERLRQEKDYDYIKKDIFQLMEESKEGLSRMRKIVQDLKSFSRVGEEGWQWSDLHKGIESTLNIVWNELKYKCTVVKEYGELPEVYCMPPQLNQVFMNLLVNASQAIEEKGTITIRTGARGEEVWVEVEDSGKGIAPEHLNRIFEPFFTTKPVGVGTGLGLSLSYNIVQKHGGRIEAESAPGRGTKMRVWLPIKPAEQAAG